MTQTDPAEIAVEPLSASLGARLKGMNLAELDLRQKAFLSDAIWRHHVVCVSGQEITPEAHIAFASMLGEIYIHPRVAGLKGHPEIIGVHSSNATTECWHSDSTHSEEPPLLTTLVARIIPPFGNDTMFANQHLAYEALSPAMQAMLGGLRAIHSSVRPMRAADPRYAPNGYVGEASHPVVRGHPKTGRKALFVNAEYTRRFDGMTEEESQPLLGFLFAHCARVEFTHRHRWHHGDVLIWDNAAVQHAVVGDLPEGSSRYLERVTISGPRPV